MANSRATSLLPLLLLLAGCPVYGPAPVQRDVQVSCQSDFDCPLEGTLCYAYSSPVSEDLNTNCPTVHVFHTIVSD